ncbi:hypothetical protein ACIP88_31965 [Streptomyces uncialis]
MRGYEARPVHVVTTVMDDPLTGSARPASGLTAPAAPPARR